jgi:hypothetical protein
MAARNDIRLPIHCRRIGLLPGTESLGPGLVLITNDGGLKLLRYDGDVIIPNPAADTFYTCIFSGYSVVVAGCTSGAVTILNADGTFIAIQLAGCAVKDISPSQKKKNLLVLLDDGSVIEWPFEVRVATHRALTH